MEWLAQGIDFFLHLDRYLLDWVRDYGILVYGLLFLIVFCETGLVVTPLLPGDSLLFSVGALSAAGALDFWVAAGTLFAAAVLGDAVNYAIGRYFGERVRTWPESRWWKQAYLRRTEAFYAKYGAKTVVLARFVPIVRTFAPFVAGVGTMSRRIFFTYNVIGGATWVMLCLGAGHWFGDLPLIADNFGLAVLGIVALSLLPAVFEVLRARSRAGGAAW